VIPSSVCRLILLDAADSVAVTTRLLRAGDVAVTADGHEFVATTRVPSGHKLALRDHVVGEAVIKYGAPIGVASAVIGRGEHVHSHNLVTVRGRKAALRSGTGGV
jgi:altronate hydrolase